MRLAQLVFAGMGFKANGGKTRTDHGISHGCAMLRIGNRIADTIAQKHWHAFETGSRPEELPPESGAVFVATSHENPDHPPIVMGHRGCDCRGTFGTTRKSCTRHRPAFGG